mgnify:CR=1 FL=1
MPKAALAKMGVCGEHLRLPLIETTEENKKALFGAMDEFENWGIRMKVLLYGYGLMGKKVAHQLRKKDEFDLLVWFLMNLMKKHQKQCIVT